MHSRTEGFKTSFYRDKNFIACSTQPTISSKVIRALGESFCNIDPVDLTLEKLNLKHKSSSAVGHNAPPKDLKAPRGAEDHGKG